MSFRPELKPFPVITSGNMAGSITGSVTIIQKISMLSYGFSWSGTSPVGTLSVQVSNDYSLDAQGNVSNSGSDWTTLVLNVAGTSASSISVSGNTGTAFIDIDTCGAYAIRPVYTRTSGTGTLQGTINGKVS